MYSTVAIAWAEHLVSNPNSSAKSQSKDAFTVCHSSDL